VRPALLLDEDHPGRPRLRRQQKLDAAEALSHGMAEKAAEFKAAGAEVYRRE
jgi:hypothetical protein